ncbi:MAG: hypothetical protein EZS28_030233 [Streblomastix strix]|uniref:DH domain-containing protein n=1 Tax=Streblomastix strix TaxID=222440 RepID=A0A5J4UVR8_9EUKA|nr:MAG: hypothetical protein EZS28_030233 [Streblomastix strix]
MTEVVLLSVIHKLLETERIYVKCLNQLKEFQFEPIHQHFTQENTSEIDPKLEELMNQTQIILLINEEFLNELEQRLGSNTSVDTPISDIIQKYAPQFKKYTGYMDVQEKATEAYYKLMTEYPSVQEESIRLQKEAKTFVNFDSLLITPVQRIPRFIMLTKEILKHTPNNHINREGLQQSMNSLKDIASFINDHIKQKHIQYLLVIVYLFVYLLPYAINQIIRRKKPLPNLGSAL